MKPGAPDTWFDHELGAVGNARHAQARLVQLDAARLVVRLHDRQRARGSTSMPTPNALATQSAVMSSWVGPMPPVVKTIGVACAQRVQRGDDLGLVVGHHAHLVQVDADVGQVLGDVADVLVLGAPGQDLVADDEKGGGDERAGAVMVFPALAMWRYNAFNKDPARGTTPDERTCPPCGDAPRTAPIAFAPARADPRRIARRTARSACARPMPLGAYDPSLARLFRAAVERSRARLFLPGARGRRRGAS